MLEGEVKVPNGVRKNKNNTIILLYICLFYLIVLAIGPPKDHTNIRKMNSTKKGKEREKIRGKHYIRVVTVDCIGEEWMEKGLISRWSMGKARLIIFAHNGEPS